MENIHSQFFIFPNFERIGIQDNNKTKQKNQQLQSKSQNKANN